MSSLRSIGLRIAACLFAIAVVSGFIAPAGADPKPLSKAEQAKVDKAVEKGVAYLKRVQGSSGVFPREFRGKLPDNFPFIVGQTLVPALALLECGVAPDDPTIKKVTAYLRKSTSKLDSTYELSLAILYLDKLGQRQDEATIRSLALRLVAGQSYTGGWTYRCPRLKVEREADFLKALRALQENQNADNQAPRKGTKRGGEGAAAPETPKSLRNLAVFQKLGNLFARKEKGINNNRSILLVGQTDNSNTQFAMLGLWAASRHELPLAPTFRLLVRRFEFSQGDDGTWDYSYQYGGHRAIRPYYIADTGVGLLALAIGRATLLADEKMQERREKQIIWGLTALSRDIGQSTGQPNYYLLWTIERVAALYQLQTFGDKDWYGWGAERLVATQTADGDWPHDPSLRSDVTGSYGASLNTSFALLFLKRSNLTKDLTAKLPLKPADLNKGIMALTASHPSPKDISSSGSPSTKKQSTAPP